MQNQAPGYFPAKRPKGMRNGLQEVRAAGKSGNTKNQARKTSPYSKNRNGAKTVKVAQGYRGMTLNQPLSRVPVQSNNLPGFNAPIGGGQVLL